MHTKELTIFTNMCLVYKDNKILVQERTKSDWPGITLPGGHVEKGENFYDAIIREVKEETGLTLLKPVLCGIEEYKQTKDEDRYVILFYKCNEFEGELKSSDEGEIYWLDRDKLDSVKLSFDLDRMIEIMESDTLSELIYYFEDGEYKSKVV
ncbi:MAG: 8-oxo-dGTP diphosphatase [Erysipelotrichaceae bacterium]|nr:8-oxo-dGTP diphosphatase [Solobacterium sp.]MDY4791887.1 8-oxo-dGTP diphosphatase [Erysipelotrichaceae bacterium]